MHSGKLNNKLRNAYTTNGIIGAPNMAVNAILNNTLNNCKRGFTLIELLVVLAILALLLTLATPKYFNSLERAKEATLKQDLNIVRDSLDKYYADNGQYPDTLENLVDKKYIRELPFDPITESTTTWLFDAPEPTVEGNIANIHSGALGMAKDGSQYSQW